MELDDVVFRAGDRVIGGMGGRNLLRRRGIRAADHLMHRGAHQHGCPILAGRPHLPSGVALIEIYKSEKRPRLAGQRLATEMETPGLRMREHAFNEQGAVFILLQAGHPAQGCATTRQGERGGALVGR